MQKRDRVKLKSKYLWEFYFFYFQSGVTLLIPVGWGITWNCQLSTEKCIFHR